MQRVVFVLAVAVAAVALTTTIVNANADDVRTTEGIGGSRPAVQITQLPRTKAEWLTLNDELLTQHRVDEALHLAKEMTARLDPNDADVRTALGSCYHHAGDFESARVVYESLLAENPNSVVVLSNMGALHQQTGSFDKAESFYRRALALNPNTPHIWNNIGAVLLTERRDDEALEALTKSLELAPEGSHARVNLGTIFQEKGMLANASDMFISAAAISDRPALYLRAAVMMPPISDNFSDMLAERQRLQQELSILRSQVHTDIADPGASIERIHFYSVYHGVNDRPVQETVTATYLQTFPMLHYVAPNARPQPPAPTLPTENRKIRIGFCSKFFGLYEPHGMLLEGIIRFLPRSRFHVVAMPITIWDKPLMPEIMKGADEVVVLPMSLRAARDTIASKELDILVFADMNSEPMTHFLGFFRFAAVQMVFWGNPITSGNPAIDYFVSGEQLEHPLRPRMGQEDEPYSEQVVLLEGQAIWYSPPELPKRFPPRSQFNISDDWTVYFCPQSAFKMHPLFDHVIAQILRRDRDGRAVFTTGRREEWTDKFRNRLLRAVHPDDRHRVVFIQRVSAHLFLELMGSVADVVLHPVPFGGSRTSADGLALGLPVVTKPTTYLRGRMAGAFFRTMNIPELVAHNMSDYVDIAVRLGKNPAYRAEVSAKIKANVHLIWRDYQVVHEWSNLFARSVGVQPVPLRDLLHEASQNRAALDVDVSLDPMYEGITVLSSDSYEIDVNKELSLHAERVRNRQQFAEAFGSELSTIGPPEEVDPVEHTMGPAFRSLVGNDNAVACPNTRRMRAASAILGHELYSQPVMGTLPVSRKCRTGAAAEEESIATDPTSLADSGVERATVEDKDADEDINIFDPAIMERLTPLGFTKQSLLRVYKRAVVDLNKHQHDSLIADGKAFPREKPLLYAAAVLLGDGDMDAAIEIAEIARAAAPNSSFVLAMLGALYYHVDRLDLAEAAARRALEIVPDYSIALNNLGAILLRTGREEEGLEFIHQSMLVQRRGAGLWNYLNTLKENGRCDVAVPAAVEHLHLPPLGQGTEYLAAMAGVEWSPFHHMDIDMFEQRLRKVGRYEHEASLLTEIARLQREHMMEIEALLLCLLELEQQEEGDQSHVGDAQRAVFNLLEYGPMERNFFKYSSVHPNFTDDFDGTLSGEVLRESGDGGAAGDSAAVAPIFGLAPPLEHVGVHLITQFFHAADKPLKQRDLLEVLFLNLANPGIRRVHVFTETDDDRARLEQALATPFSTVSGRSATFSPVMIRKLVWAGTSGRLCFDTAFQYANDNLRGKLVALANSDIHFDESMARIGDMRTTDMQNTVYALLKHVRRPDSTVSFHLRVNSQDAWLFQAPIRPDVIQWSHFELGKARCDNRLVYILRQAGYHVMNPALALRAIELDSSQREGGLYGVGTEAVQGEGDVVLVSDRWFLG